MVVSKAEVELRFQMNRFDPNEGPLQLLANHIEFLTEEEIKAATDLLADTAYKIGKVVFESNWFKHG